MKRLVPLLGAALTFLLAIGCAGQQQLPTELEIPLTPSKGYSGGAQGKAVINTVSGTEIKFHIEGLDPNGLYTVFLVNPKSQMFQGVGPAPYVLTVDPDGNVDITSTMTKDIYKKFVLLAIYSNPGGKPIENPVGVKTTLGPLVKQQLPTMILEGKLR